ncbi:MAG TPA: hypothetical protein VI028_02920 [Solirubrobacterales bacterium]
MAVALTAGTVLCGLAAPAAAASAPEASVTFAVLPRDTTVADLARVSGMSLGLLSAGIGEVSSQQTFLDVSQGRRIGDSLYHRSLPGLFPFAREVPNWAEVIERADDAPADLIPGLLATRLRVAGVPASAEQPMTAAALTAADVNGLVSPSPPGECVRRRCPGLAVVRAGEAELPGLVRRLGGGDLLIALAAPPPGENEALPIGIAGRGFNGDLTSDSTRTDGYVLSTDLAPTILRRLGLAVPDQMDGEPIRSEGELDPGAIEDRARRMKAIPDRRAPVVIGCLAAWVLLAGAAAFAPAARRRALAWLALAFAYMPLMLLAGAAIEPSAVAEAVLVGLGAAALAAVTLRFVPGWWALAGACAITVSAYGIDVVAGSGLTELSLLGPNPIFGVRFYGIGNELEALIAVMVPVSVGAGLSAYTGWGRGVSRRGAGAAFVIGGLVAALVFAAGRFGADVGAAIVLPVGAAVAVVALPDDFEHFAPNTGVNRSRSSFRRLSVAVIAAALAGVAALLFIDLVSGGNSHLTRSVLDAGGAGDLADLADRRLRLSAHDFGQAAGNPLFWVVVVGICAAIAQRRRIDVWLGPAPIARAGLLGACVAVAVGVLVNDSGATFLVLGSLAMGAFLAFAWSQAGEISSSPRNRRASAG